nr:hypothetical protein [Candidatus Njordarchaeota archaeon]
MSRKKVEEKASEQIISLSAKYMVISVLAMAIGTVSLAYSFLLFVVFHYSLASVIVVGAVFIGLAFIVIGIFLNFWGLYWLRSEGKRLKQRSREK